MYNIKRQYQLSVILHAGRGSMKLQHASPKFRRAEWSHESAWAAFAWLPGLSSATYSVQWNDSCRVNTLTRSRTGLKVTWSKLKAIWSSQAEPCSGGTNDKLCPTAPPDSRFIWLSSWVQCVYVLLLPKFDLVIVPQNTRTSWWTQRASQRKTFDHSSLSGLCGRADIKQWVNAPLPRAVYKKTQAVVL